MVSVSSYVHQESIYTYTSQVYNHASSAGVSTRGELYVWLRELVTGCPLTDHVGLDRDARCQNPLTTLGRSVPVNEFRLTGHQMVGQSSQPPSVLPAYRTGTKFLLPSNSPFTARTSLRTSSQSVRAVPGAPLAPLAPVPFAADLAPALARFWLNDPSPTENDDPRPDIWSERRYISRRRCEVYQSSVERRETRVVDVLDMAEERAARDAEREARLSTGRGWACGCECVVAGELESVV